MKNTYLNADWRHIKKARDCDYCSKHMEVESEMNYWCFVINKKIKNVYLCPECASKIKEENGCDIFPEDFIEKVSRKTH